MASAEEILNSPEYQNANLETKRAIFVKHIAKTPDFANANKETQDAIMQRFGIAEAPPAEAKPAEEKPAPEGVPSIQEATGVTPEGALVGGALTGAAGTLLPKVTGTTEAQVARAKERLAAAIDRFKATREAAARSSTFGVPIEDIQAAQDAARAEDPAREDRIHQRDRLLEPVPVLR